jgi:hypothetical protein
MEGSHPMSRVRGKVDPNLIEPSLAYAREHEFSIYDLAQWVLAGRPGFEMWEERDDA